MRREIHVRQREVDVCGEDKMIGDVLLWLVAVLGIVMLGACASLCVLCAVAALVSIVEGWRHPRGEQSDEAR